MSVKYSTFFIIMSILLGGVVFADEYTDISGLKVFDLTPSIVNSDDMIIKFNTNKVATCNCTELDGVKLVGNDSAMQVTGGFFHLKSFETKNLTEGNHLANVSCYNPLNVSDLIDFSVNVTLKK